MDYFQTNTQSLTTGDMLGAYKNLDELNTPKFHAVSNRDLTRRLFTMAPLVY